MEAGANTGRSRWRFYSGHTGCLGLKGVCSSFLPFLLLLLVALPAAFIACDTIEDFAASPTSPAPTARPTSTVVPASSTRPASAGASSASGIVIRVSIAPMSDGIPKYDRGEWRHWIDEDRDCQNARQEALIAESSSRVTFQSEDECRVAEGRWTGPYTGKDVTDPGDLDIDHMVPLENAHRSGGWSWNLERKREYANYLGYQNHLIAAISSANRSKGSKGPEEWRPPLESYWCSYATDWATIKRDWGLSVTEAEFAALTEMLAACSTPVLLQPAQGEAPAFPASTKPPSATLSATPVSATPSVMPVSATPPAAPLSTPPGMRYDPFGPDRNCSDFETYQEALAFYIAAGGPDADPHNLDSDDDGEPCESLPGGPSESASLQQNTPVSFYASLRSGLQRGDSSCPPGTSGESNCEQAPTATPIPTPLHTATPTPMPASTATPTPTSMPASTATPTPTSMPASTATPTPEPREEHFQDRNCSDFENWQAAQVFYLSEGGPGVDSHGLDGDSDGTACQSLPGAPRSALDLPSSEPTPEPPYTPLPEDQAGDPAYPGLLFDPDGLDRNCGDFSSWWNAQNFFLAAGGPGEDPHSLDSNGDGTACESLPGAPEQDEPAGDSEPLSSGEGEFVDRNCADFGNWEEAQNFFLAAGGPGEDPHSLDSNGDGTACESLPGAPEQDEPAGDSDPLSSGEGEFVDRNCADFGDWEEAQNFFLAAGGPGEDPHSLDSNGDGTACESLPGAPEQDEPAGDSEPLSSGEGEFVDRNCADFGSWEEAQNFFLTAGGPGEDPHGLDSNGDGTACESLPGAPEQDEPAGDSEPLSSGEGEFVDRNCADFGSWEEAQNFFLAAGGPGEDPHSLDSNGDGVACESLPGAPKE